MAVIQPALQISDDTLQGLLSGEYTRLGGVIRDQKGRLVELLTDASIEGGK